MSSEYPRWKWDGKECADCGKRICNTSTRCSTCGGRFAAEYKAEWPSPEELQAEVARTNKCAVARRLGVSEGAVRIHMKRHPAPGRLVYDAITHSYEVVHDEF